MSEQQIWLEKYDGASFAVKQKRCRGTSGCAPIADCFLQLNDSASVLNVSQREAYGPYQVAFHHSAGDGSRRSPASPLTRYGTK
jgi:hypothetical protein